MAERQVRNGRKQVPFLEKGTMLTPYPWPFEHATPVLQFALDIAMGYLEFTHAIYPFSQTEVACAGVIPDEWPARTSPVVAGKQGPCFDRNGPAHVRPSND